MRIVDLMGRLRLSPDQLRLMVEAWNTMRHEAVSVTKEDREELPEIHAGMIPFCNATIMYALLGQYLNECQDMDLYQKDEERKVKEVMRQMKKAWPGKKPIPMAKGLV